MLCCRLCCAGLEWVAQNHDGPSVVIMSLGVAVGAWSKPIEHAARHLVQEQGISVVVASGAAALALGAWPTSAHCHFLSLARQAARCQFSVSWQGKQHA